MRDKCNWQTVLDTWFEDTRSNPDAIGSRMAWWFFANEDRDQKLKNTYQGCCEAALEGQLAKWQQEPSSRLSLILLLDQFPRNLFRGTPRAFAGFASLHGATLKSNNIPGMATSAQIQKN